MGGYIAAFLAGFVIGPVALGALRKWFFGDGEVG